MNYGILHSLGFDLEAVGNSLTFSSDEFCIGYMTKLCQINFRFRVLLKFLGLYLLRVATTGPFSTGKASLSILCSIMALEKSEKLGENCLLKK